MSIIHLEMWRHDLLSLSHLASGVAIVTESGERDGWLTASASIWASSRWSLPMSSRISLDEENR
jgi:hypothetical protein